MPAIERFVRLTAGAHVLRNAQIRERMTTRMNWPQGKNGATYVFKKRLNWRSIV